MKKKEKYNFVNRKGLYKHCVESVQTRSFFWSVFSPNTGENGPKNTPYLDTFHAVKCSVLFEEKCIKKRDIVCPFLLTVKFILWILHRWILLLEHYFPLLNIIPLGLINFDIQRKPTKFSAIFFGIDHFWKIILYLKLPIHFRMIQTQIRLPWIVPVPALKLK